jgi:ADP-ribose pyrophosphatase YjhB (NUDIX family)
MAFKSHLLTDNAKEERRLKNTGRTATAIIPFTTDKILLIKRRTVPFRGYCSARWES